MVTSADAEWITRVNVALNQLRALRHESPEDSNLSTYARGNWSFNINKFRRSSVGGINDISASLQNISC